MDEAPQTPEIETSFTPESIAQSERLSAAQLILLMFGVFVLTVVASYGFFGFLSLNKQQQSTVLVASMPYVEQTSTDAFGRMIEKSVLYEPGDSALLEGDRVTAQAEYVRLLDRTNDVSIEGAVWYRIALTKSDIAERVALLQHIAAEEAYSNDVRSRAVEAMGLLYTRAASDAVRAEVTEHIFTIEPYKAYMKEGDITLAYMRLFEHASSLSPATLADAYVGLVYIDWAEAAYLDAMQDDMLNEEERTEVDSYIAQAYMRMERAAVGLMVLTDPVDTAYLDEAAVAVGYLKDRYAQATQ